MRLTVCLSGPGGLMERRSLDAGSLIIGRAADCDLVLVDPDRTLSNRHCQISRDATGWILTDTSTNGVFLGETDEPIGRGRSVPLADGDTAHLGPYLLQIVLEQAQSTGRGDERAVPDGAIEGERPDTMAPTNGLELPYGHQDGPVGSEPTPWLSGIESGAHGHGMMASRAGWDAPPDPQAATGGIDPLLPSVPGASEPDGFVTRIGPADGGPGMMTLPTAASVLPLDWDQPDQPGRDGASASPRVEPSQPSATAMPFISDLIGPIPTLDELAPLSDEGSVEPRIVPGADLASILGAPMGDPLPGEHVPGEHVPFEPAVSKPAPTRPGAEVPPVLRPWHATPTPTPTPSTAGEPMPADAASLMAAFLEGAGINPAVAQAQDPHLVLRNAGAVLRNAVGGMRDILASRALVKAELRVEQTMIRPRDNNVLKFVPDLESCMMALLGEPMPGFLPGTECMQQSLEDVKRHELAMVAALSGALDDLLAQLDPDRIRAECDEEEGRGSLFAGTRKARYWQVFERLHKEVRERQDDPASRSVIGPLASAYARQITRVS